MGSGSKRYGSETTTAGRGFQTQARGHDISTMSPTASQSVHVVRVDSRFRSVVESARVFVSRCDAVASAVRLQPWTARPQLAPRRPIPTQQFLALTFTRTKACDCISGHAGAAYKHSDREWYRPLLQHGVKSFKARWPRLHFSADKRASCRTISSGLILQLGRIVDSLHTANPAGSPRPSGCHGLIERHELLILAPQAAHGDGAGFGLALADDEDDRHLGERVFAHLVVDLLVAQIGSTRRPAALSAATTSCA